MKILLLSAYHAVSHQYWAEGLQKHFSCYEWTVLQLSPRYFAWRIRGNPLSWATRYRDVLEQKYDLILATSMVDLACLRGVVPSLARVPAIAYFHENQFAYPLSTNANSILEAQLVNLYSALSAECIVFNTEYNRQSFLAGVDALVKKFPDEKPNDLPALLSSKSRCLLVPLDFDVPSLMREEATENEYPAEGKSEAHKRQMNFQLVWNHRWEYDKGPSGLLKIIQALDPGLNLCFHIVGQQFRAQAEVFSDIKNALEERQWLGAWGFQQKRTDYLRLLKSSDLVLSTALHDFQGLAMMEACALGCVPIAPKRLAYPELFPESQLYGSFEGHGSQEAAGAAALIQSSLKRARMGYTGHRAMLQWTWPQMHRSYRELFESVAGVEVSCASTKSNDS